MPFDPQSNTLINTIIPPNQQGQINNILTMPRVGYLGTYNGQPVYHKRHDYTTYGKPLWTVLANGDVHLFGFYDEKRNYYKLKPRCGTPGAPDIVPF